MKTFLVTVSSLCLCGILFCFWAYATGFVSLTTDRSQGDVPSPKTTQTLTVFTSVEQATMGATESECSPCAERMAWLLDVMEQEGDWDITTFFEPPDIPSETAAQRWVWLSSEQREQSQQLIDRYDTEEGLRRLRESDPDTARQLERERRQSPNREVPDEVESSTQ